MQRLLCLVFLVGFFRAHGTDPYAKNEGIDIIHYRFQLALNDSTNVITGHATITLLFKKAVSEFELDLVNQNSTGAGMLVSQITQEGISLRYSHQKDRIKIYLVSPSVQGQRVTVIVDYSGIPQDGLIISKNKFGDRTFFGDNWPNRAHHWLPCVDHPSDKATCEFIVTAPEYYAVIANGRKIEESSFEKNQKVTRWEETVDIPMKVMVIGVARFAIEVAGRVDQIPVESWVYPQNRDAGFLDYGIAVRILYFFNSHIGPYPYEKLANVQSKTRYGGMENASNIFYAENSVDGKNNHDGLIAHEIAHQWFGNSATEKDWHHVWLSEGFATYFSHLFADSAHGHNRFVEEMQADRKQVINYTKNNPVPVIDTAVVELMRLLNPHSYQKGGWVLHMLRKELGDVTFWKGIRTYYGRYRNQNALTSDFQTVMEEVSGKDLDSFFDQWLWRGGHPKISGFWKFDAASKSVRITIRQVQHQNRFIFPLEVGLRSSGVLEISNLRIDKESQEFMLRANNKPSEVILDPNTWLLFEGELEPK